jgi:hypothetical protein
MTDYEELSDEEYAAEMGRALGADDLELLRLDGTPECSEIIFRSVLKDRRYRRKPKPRRIQGYIAVCRDGSLGSHDTASLYENVECLPSWAKEGGWDIIYIDQEVPE